MEDEMVYAVEVIFKPGPETLAAKANEAASNGWSLKQVLMQPNGDAWLILEKKK